MLIFSAPSGAGKTTLVHHLLNFKEFKLEFSVSACSRSARGNELDGKDYYFLSVDEFKAKIKNDEFLEWEEVYKDNYYGSLKSEVDRITAKGNNVIFDVDVKGGLNIKKFYGSNVLAIFVMPPSIDELGNRLIRRLTDNEEAIKTRLDKAKCELEFADNFDVIIINESLELAKKEIVSVVRNFLSK